MGSHSALVQRLNEMIADGRVSEEKVPDDFSWLKDTVDNLREAKSKQAEKAIAAARECYGSDEIEVDDDCIFSWADDGVWVGAWLWVPHGAIGMSEDEAA